MALKWKGITVGIFGMNAYVLWCDETRAGVLIDPGDEIERIAEVVTKENVNLERIIITHAHIDHILQASAAQERFNLPLYLHRDDIPLLENLQRQAESLGLFSMEIRLPKIDGYLKEGDAVSFGNQEMKIVHGPGHSPGSIMLISDRLAVVGDVLFQGSIGRTDLPGGSFDVLIKTIKEKLMILDDEVRILPGHGEETTIGFERLNNPFLQSNGTSMWA